MSNIKKVTINIDGNDKKIKERKSTTKKRIIMMQ